MTTAQLSDPRAQARRNVIRGTLVVLTTLIGLSLIASPAMAAVVRAQYDTNGDGWIDTVYVDSNYDGYSEIVYWDSNYDRKVDKAFIDANLDGKYEVVMQDNNQDGNFENGRLDANGNGTRESWIYPYKNGIWVYFDLNENGLYEYQSTDANGDGFHEWIRVDANWDGSADTWKANSATSSTSGGPAPSLNQTIANTAVLNGIFSAPSVSVYWN